MFKLDGAHQTTHTAYKTLQHPSKYQTLTFYHHNKQMKQVWPKYSWYQIYYLASQKTIVCRSSSNNRSIIGPGAASKVG